MQTAIDQFRVNMSRVRHLGSIVDTLEADTTQPLDPSDVLRAEVVLAVSALDQFVHEVVRLGMLEAYRGDRPRTQRFLRFEVSLGGALDSIESGGGNDGDERWLDDQIRDRHGHLSFQTPDNVSGAMRLISDVRLWNEIGSIIGMRPQEVRGTLSSIVNRRNRIAHEADASSSPYEELWPIDHSMVNDAVDFIEDVAEAIYEVVAADDEDPSRTSQQG